MQIRIGYFFTEDITLNNENSLKQSALAFEKLLNTEYKIVAAKKKKISEIVLFFKKEHFFHLIGLNKLVDLQVLRNNKEKIFNDILSEKITYSEISKSLHFSEMSDRLKYFSSLENILDDSKLLIKHNSNKTKSKIKAEYIIYFIKNDSVVHYFVDRDYKENKFFGRTFFVRKDKAYLCDAPYKILKKEKYTTIKKSTKN